MYQYIYWIVWMHFRNISWFTSWWAASRFKQRRKQLTSIHYTINRIFISTDTLQNVHIVITIGYSYCMIWNCNNIYNIISWSNLVTMQFLPLLWECMLESMYAEWTRIGTEISQVNKYHHYINQQCILCTKSCKNK